MPSLHDQSLEIGSTIYRNAKKVNEVSKQRAPFAAASAELARNANVLASQIIEIAELNTKSLSGSRKILDSMHQMTSAVDQGADLIRNVESSMASFTGCFSKIKGLADRITDTAKFIEMVSVVARVEAARASDSGRNFTAVADEVKHLSTESASHANDIRESIARLNNAAREMIERVGVLRNHLLGASECGSRTDQYLDEISETIDEATRSADLTNKEVMSKKESMMLIESHMDVLSDGVKSSITGSAANMGLIDNVLQLFNVSLEKSNSAASESQIVADQELVKASEIIRQIANNAKAVNDASIQRKQVAELAIQLARNNREASTSGHKRVQKSQEAMKSAIHRVEQSFEIVSEIDDVSRLVEDTTGTVSEMKTGFSEIEQMAAQIEKISSATNILALNASVEAYRAGEEGNGFAVVASEVNMLSASTGKLVQEIDQLVVELLTIGDEFNQHLSALRKAVEKLSHDGKKVTGGISELKKILEQTKNEWSQILSFLDTQLSNLDELEAKSAALGNDAAVAVAGSAKNIELCKSLLKLLENMTVSA